MECERIALVFLCLVVTVRCQLFLQEPYDYCDPKLKLCEYPGDHTMCKYPVPGPSPQCTKGLHEPLTPNEKDRILYWHNRFRSLIANGTEKIKRRLPTASNMRQMYWDGELETIAARWAEQCTSMTNAVIYDKCRNTKRFRVSQNVGTRRVNGTAIDKQAPQIVITWYKENKDFDPVLVDKFAPTDGEKVSVKQFANIIWADTYAVGCARVIFQEKLPLIDSKPSIWTSERLVCNYGPGGNEVGKPIYKRGIPCESCPSGTKCSRHILGLCAIQDTDKTKEKVEKETTVETKTKLTSESPATVFEEEEEEDYQDYTCRGGDCHKNFPTTLDIINFAKPTARKKTQNVDKRSFPTRKVRRWHDKEPKNGDRCKCYIPAAENYSGSSRIYSYLDVLSIFILLQTFLFST